MAHVIPTFLTATRPTYTPAALRRKSDISATNRNPGSATDFGTILSNQSAPPAASSAAAAAAAPAPAAPSGTVGSVTPTVSAAPAAAPASTMAPTAPSLFGANPWSTNAGGKGPGGSYSYNPYYFATPATAAKVAQMLGGQVVTMNAITPYGPFQQNQPNQMVQMPDGRLINAGLVAGFYDHGYTQQMVDKMIAGEVSGNTVY